jgi:hypothetical protein
MSNESVCQVAHSWVDTGSFHTHLVVRFMIFTVQNIFDTPSYHAVLQNIFTWYKFSVLFMIHTLLHMILIVCHKFDFSCVLRLRQI